MVRLDLEVVFVDAGQFRHDRTPLASIDVNGRENPQPLTGQAQKGHP